MGTFRPPFGAESDHCQGRLRPAEAIRERIPSDCSAAHELGRFVVTLAGPGRRQRRPDAEEPVPATCATEPTLREQETDRIVVLVGLSENPGA
jgi:hypothetical protein